MTSPAKQLVTCDFDGTLTTRDSLLLFIRYAKGAGALWGSLLLYSPLLVLMKLHLYDNEKMKQRLFAHHFKGMELSRFNEICRDFARDRQDIIRPKGLATLQKLSREGATVLIVSASIDNWVAPFFASMPQVLIVGTQIETLDNRITGRFRTKNCYGAEKVRRIKELFPHREAYVITAFGDSRGDNEMLNYADKGYYKPFQ